MSFIVISPDSTERLLELIRQYQGRKYRFAAGCTDLLLELDKQPEEALTVINLSRLEDPLFTTIDTPPSPDIADEFSTRIGALVTADQIVRSRDLNNRFPVLCSAAERLASTQIRQVATVGGNICTASPAGDISCSLVALDAQVDLLSSGGTSRILPLTKFFLDVRKTGLKKDEVLRSVFIPRSKSQGITARSQYVKIGTRRSMECAVVSLAVHIQTDNEQVITRAGIAVGSASPTIQCAESAGDFITGKPLSSINDEEAEIFADRVLESVSPISDIRASAWYRKTVLHNISKNIITTKDA